MIRFSAALVAAAIGVLIGGIVTSGLLLVYIAIVLSVVALVALAVGVALKREELFGRGQGTVPAQAGIGPVQSAHAGDSGDRNPSNGHVTPPPLQGAAVGADAAFAGDGWPAPPRSGGAQPGGTWGAPAGRDPWSAPATATSFPAASQAPAPSGVPVVGWDTPAPGEPQAFSGRPARNGGPEPRSWDMPAPSVFAPRTPRTAGPPAAAPSPGPGAGRPDWFSQPDEAAGSEAPAPQPWSSRPWLNGDIAVPGDKGQEDNGKTRDAALADEDDDWPARYAWLDDRPLDDRPEEDGRSGDTTGANGGTAPPTVPAGVVPLASGPATDVPVAGADPGTPPPARAGAPEAPEAAAASLSDTVTAKAEATRPLDAAAASPGDRGEDHGAGLAVPAGAGEPATPRMARHPDAAAETAKSPGEPSATAADETDLVAVVRGVPRFHRQDCVLIRFMPDGDTRKLSVAEAEEAGCTPCSACYPEG